MSDLLIKMPLKISPIHEQYGFETREELEEFNNTNVDILHLKEKMEEYKIFDQNQRILFQDEMREIYRKRKKE